MKMITVVLDDSWYIFDNFIEILWQSMILSLYTVSVLRILFLCEIVYVEIPDNTITSQKCVWLLL